MPKNRPTKEFASFLAEKGFVIVNETSVRNASETDFSLAEMIFKNKDILIPFLIEEALAIRGKARSVLHSFSKKTTLVRFFTQLKEEGLLLDWTRIKGKGYQIEFPPQEEKLRFFRFEWAERCFQYIILNVVRTFCEKERPGLSFRAFQNVELKRKDETELFTELDLVIQIAKRFYIFEIKSGPWIRIMQWAKREEAFVDKNGPVRQIVCTIHENIPADIFEPQILMNLGNIEQRFRKMLDADFSNANLNALQNPKPTRLIRAGAAKPSPAAKQPPSP